MLLNIVNRVSTPGGHHIVDKVVIGRVQKVDVIDLPDLEDFAKRQSPHA
jgi:hypothetical protein